MITRKRSKAPSTIRIDIELVDHLEVLVRKYPDLIFAPECSFIVINEVLKSIHGFVCIGHKPTLRWIKVFGADLPLAQGFLAALLKRFANKNSGSFLEYTFYE